VDPNEFVDYLAEVGGKLVGCGCPSYRLEEVIRVIASHEGYHAEAFGLPTAVFVSLKGPGLDHELLRMVRVTQWGTDLGRLAAVDAIFNDVVERKATIAEARARLEALERRRWQHRRAVDWAAGTVVSGAAAIFFRGGLREVLVSAAAGGLVAVLGSFLSRGPNGRLLVDFLGGLAAAIFAWMASYADPDLSREVIVLSGVIGLVPGMTFTTGLAEVAQKNLVAGSARLTEALVTFLSILFGIAMAVGAEQVLGVATVAPPGGATRVGLGIPYQAAALVAASTAFAVIFSVPRRFVWAAVLSGAIGYVATALATRTLPPHVAAFVAAVCVCLFANALARVTKRPAQLFQVPGMMLLVPGSFGFASLEDFLRGEVLGGATKGFSMMLIAGALVTGILAANLVLPAKKIL
jgi:uncharacterized membrane protein YjjP (DUF1212 family)